MEQIILSGTLFKDAESCIDKSGKTYSRFTVVCGSNDSTGRAVFTRYHCICYISGYEKMKKGDQVFVTGKLTAKLGIDENENPSVSLSVMVFQISGGYRAEERQKTKKTKQE